MTLSLTSGGRGGSHSLYTAAAVDATGTNSSDIAPAGGYLYCTVQAVWASVSSGTASFKLQCSNDGTNWDDIQGATGVTSGTSGSASIHLDSLPGVFLKLTITNAAGAGTITPSFAMKR